MSFAEIERKKPLRCASYARTSTGGDSGLRQFEMLESEIVRRGFSWVILGRFLDEGVSGGGPCPRAGFERMIDEIQSGRLQVDAVLVGDFSRLGRSAVAAARCHELLEKHGISVLTAQDGFADRGLELG